MKKENTNTIEKIEIGKLIPYAKNSRTHSEAQVAQIAASIREFGFNNPVLIGNDNDIIAGHGRVLAARKLDLEEVPCIRLGHLTETQKRAYVIADNRIAENAGWDNEMLKLELADLKDTEIDLDILGFDEDFLNNLGFGDPLDPSKTEEDSPYSRKIEAPIYEIQGDKPELKDLFNSTKTEAIIKKIKESDLSDIEKHFLTLAAYRHTVFDFGKIAEYYAHSSDKLQSFFENSALIIIDFEKAIEQGYVQMCEDVRQSYLADTQDDIQEENDEA
jgi:hypothetical protein